MIRVPEERERGGNGSKTIERGRKRKKNKSQNKWEGRRGWRAGGRRLRRAVVSLPLAEESCFCACTLDISVTFLLNTLPHMDVGTSVGCLLPTVPPSSSTDLALQNFSEDKEQTHTHRHTQTHTTNIALIIPTVTTRGSVYTLQQHCQFWCQHHSKMSF